MSEPIGSTVRFGQRPTRGLLFGLSGLRVAILGLGIALLVGGLFGAGVLGAAVAFPGTIACVVAALSRWHGQPALDAAPVATSFAVRERRGQTRYRHRVDRPRPSGSMALPGDAAPLRYYEDPESGAVMVHDPHRATLAASILVRHPAYVLLSPDDQSRRVTGWSRALAGLAAAGNVAAVQVLEATIPDAESGVASWFEERGRHDGGFSSREYERLIAGAVGAATHRSTITLSIDLRRAARAVRAAGRGITGSAAVLRSAMAAFEASLRSSGLEVAGLLRASELAAIIRSAYDPGVLLEADHPGARLECAGPVAIEEGWGQLRHDSGYSSVLWISEWPRLSVPAHFLHALVFAPGVRRTISLVARPLDGAEALRGIRRDKVEYLTDASERARIGQLGDLRDEQQYVDVLERERSLVAGHCDLVFSGFVAVTAPHREDLARAVATIERAAIQSGCETRLLYGQQAQAFVAAALPLGRSVH